ncbi:MAG: RidA family protein [Chloroflexota bacterium]
MKKVIVPPEFAHYPKDWHLSPGIDDGEYVFFSGVTGVRPDSTIASDPETQFRDTFQFVVANLAQAKLSFADVVEMTTYHVGLREHLGTFIKVKDEFVAEPYPAWTAIGVSELITEGSLLEIRIIATHKRD